MTGLELRQLVGTVARAAQTNPTRERGHTNPTRERGYTNPTRQRGLLPLLLLTVHLLNSSAANAQDLLPGEMPVEFGRKMVDPDRFPTVRELMERVDRPDQSAAVVFRFYEDRHNHYAPQWSSDGRALALLRSDVDAHTSKIVLLPSLDAESPTVLYPESASYDHMFTWSASGGHAFAFASTNEPSEFENLYLAALRDKPSPKRVTSGPGVKANPSLWIEGRQGQLFFSQAGKLQSLNVEIERPSDEQRGPPLGEGTEASLSPDGRTLVWIERTPVGTTQFSYAMKLRDLPRNTDQRLATPPGTILRNPTWSPDGRNIAFYARSVQQPIWKLYVITAPVRIRSTPARRGNGNNEDEVIVGAGQPTVVAQDVRVEEHFQNFGPSWDPRGDRLWFFGRTADQEYYPLRWTHIDGRAGGQVGYPRRLTTGLDVAVNPNRALRAIAFCAIEDLHQDVIVMLLSHEPE
jgi:hypothetical protein